jgi:hypothetical protein
VAWGTADRHALLAAHCAWYRDWVVALRCAILLPTLALAGFVAAGNQTLRGRRPTYVRATAQRRMRLRNRGAGLWRRQDAIFVHVGLVGMAFGARAARLAPSPSPAADLTHANGRADRPRGATVLETLRDTGVPHAGLRRPGALHDLPGAGDARLHKPRPQGRNSPR